MFNEATLHKYPALIGAFTSIPAKEFWDMLDKMEVKLPAHEMGRHTSSILRVKYGNER